MPDIEQSSDDWLRYEGEQPTIDDLPTSSRAAEVRTALNMVDREREEREKLRAEVERLREDLAEAEAMRDHNHTVAERLGDSTTRVDALETCLRQVAVDEEIVAKYLRSEVCDNDTDIQMAEMLEQSAAAAREVATDQGGGQ